MLKSVALFGFIFGVGIVLGLSLATWGRTAPAIAPQAPQTAPDRTIAAPPQESAPTPVPDAWQSKIAHLSEQLYAESTARQELRDELSQIKETLLTLQQRLDELTEAEPAHQAERDAGAGARRNNAETLTAAGFAPDEAEYLTNRLGQQQMDLLYLRDQAIREGWINTPRYQEETRELRSGSASVRAELGPDAYDRLLFASGRTNRVVIDSVLDSSPAQALGLQPGDAVLSYDSHRVFNVDDLRNATTAGDPGAPVTIEIIRDGQRLEYEIARGPIGVTLGRERVEP
jgi:hypothetical protein